MTNLLPLIAALCLGFARAQDTPLTPDAPTVPAPKASPVSDEKLYAELPAEKSLKSVHCDNGRVFHYTPDSLLWSARMIRGELPSASEEQTAAFLYTIAQRACWFPGIEKWSLSRLIIEYNQSLNPYWSKDKKDGGCEKEPTAGVCSAAGQARLKSNRAMEWKDAKLSWRKTIVKFATGQEVKNPTPDAIGWFEEAYWNRNGKKDVDECGVKAATIGTELFYASDCDSVQYKNRRKDALALSPTTGWFEKKTLKIE